MTAFALQIIQLKHLQHAIVLCQNVRNIAFFGFCQKIVMGMQLVLQKVESPSNGSANQNEDEKENQVQDPGEGCSLCWGLFWSTGR